MSLQFGGSYTPERPVILSPSDYGAGTSRPIKHVRYGSASSVDDDIVRCQWLLNKVLLTVEGDVTLQFFDPFGSDPPEYHSVHFSLSVESTAFITGSDASVRYPTVLDTGDFASFSDDVSDSIGITTSWGPASISVAAALRIGTGGGIVLGISDATFTDYYKGIVLQFVAAGASANPVNSSLSVSTVDDGASAALGEDVDPLLHSSTPLYWQITGGDGSVTFDTFSLERTGELTVP